MGQFHQRRVHNRTTLASARFQVSDEKCKISAAHRALTSGNACVVGADDNVLVYERTYDTESIAIVLNFGEEDRILKPPNLAKSTFVLSTYMDREGQVLELKLRGNEGVLLRR
jgi:hypothetical protein